jgi:hypothetical protein
MHNIEPFYRWLNVYNVAEDPQSPYDGKEYNFDLYSENIYGYYIDPHWDFMGSETLYIKILWVDYDLGYIIIEFIGEWNDTINNDIMNFKRNIVDHFTPLDINKYILVGENILNFHGSDDSYYEDWFEDMEDGWITAINFRDFVLDEMKQFNIDSYINSGGDLDVLNWRTMKPQALCHKINDLISRRIDLI